MSGRVTAGRGGGAAIGLRYPHVHLVNIDPANVCRVRRFALDSFDLQVHIDCHLISRIRGARATMAATMVLILMSKWTGRIERSLV